MLEILSLNTRDIYLAGYISINTESSKQTDENFYNFDRGVGADTWKSFTKPD